MKKPGIVIIAPPWPRSGTANIIAAQARAHARRGEQVFLLLSPLGIWHAEHQTENWSKTCALMKFRDVSVVDYPRTGFLGRATLAKWLIGVRPDAITAVANYSASGRLPISLHSFIAEHSINFIRVNHVFGMRLGNLVANLVRAESRNKPTIVLDTHDIQTDMYVTGKRPNGISGKVDSRERMLRGEMAIASTADTLIHISMKDYEFFSRKLPDSKHVLIPPTLHPFTEKSLMRDRGINARPSIDFVYLGNNHEGNLASVKWLLRDVLPNLGRRRPIIRVIGTIKSLFETREPSLFQRHNEMFTGEIPSIFGAYRSAKAVLAPSAAGTGASIKLVEALCAGKPTITTTIGMRGIPKKVKSSNDLLVQDGPAQFAKAMVKLLQRKSVKSRANADIYDSYFSNDIYCRSLNEALG